MDIERKTFILCFTTIIWKRIFACLILYCKEKNKQDTSEDLMKCLKYNLLAPSGIYNKLKPYIIKCLTQGFLMPKEYQGNPYVKEAIFLFRDAYNICKLASLTDESADDKRYISKKEKDFIIDYCCKVFHKNKYGIQEEQDIISDIKVPYSFTDLVDVWDIEMSLVKSEDSYFDIFRYSLFSIF